MVSDRLGLGAPMVLAEVFDVASVTDMLTMLREIARDQMTTPWRLAATTTDGVRVDLDVAGTSDDGGTWIVMVPHGAPVAELLASSDRIDDTTADQIASLFATRPGNDLSRANEAMLDELSQANNELMDLHRELAATNARLEELDRRKDAMLGTVAHDLRNPLGSISGFAQTLTAQLGATLDPSSTRLLRRIVQLAEQMLDVVEDLLDVSVIKGEGLSLARTPVDIAELVSDAVEIYRSAAAQKGVRFVVDGVDEPRIADVDEGRIMQVFDNLLSNAVKYSPNDAAATVTVTVAADAPEGELRVSVADEGAGIPVDERGRVFEPFGRTTTRPTADERSTGLGLSIAQSIVAAHKGRIGFDDRPGGGTTFWVVLPVAAP